MDKIYNPEIKMKFLSNFEDSTQETYLYMFRKSYMAEYWLEKDLYEFDINEIEKVFKQIEPSTKKVARFNGSVISSYISWAINEGFKEGDNPFDGLGYQWFDRFVDSNHKIHFTEQEIVELENKLVNAQDSVILRLLFEGISGYKYDEILNIQKKHVDTENNIITVTDEKNGVEREVKVSDRCIELIKRAFNEEKYWNKNGNATSEKRMYSILIENDYLIRSNKTKIENVDKADYFVVYRRWSTIKEELGLIKGLLPNAIRQSGMLKIAAEYYFKHKDLSKELFIQISDQFNIDKVKNNGYLVYNYRLLKEFINEENIKEIYGDDE